VVSFGCRAPHRTHAHPHPSPPPPPVTTASRSWFRIDHTWAPTVESGHVSGYLAQSLNLWVADVSSLADVLPIIVGLRNPDGSRMIRARYPNANPELGFGPPLRADSWVAPTVPIQPAVEVRPAFPNRTDSYSFIYYQVSRCRRG
jgi:hypothetical protein